MKPQAKKVMVIIGVLILVAVGLLVLESKMGNSRKQESSKAPQVSETQHNLEENKNSKQEEQETNGSNEKHKVYTSDAIVLAKKSGKVILSIDNPEIKESLEFDMDEVSYAKVYIGQTFILEYSIIDGNIQVSSLKIK